MVSLVLELAVVTALGAALWVGTSASPQAGWPAVAALVVLFFLRPVMLATTGATFGQWLTRYRIVGSRGERLSLSRAVWREVRGVVTLNTVARGRWREFKRSAPIEVSPAGTVRRWPHDQEANTWPVLIDGS